MRISLFNAHNGHLYGQILGQENAHMVFIRGGTALAYYGLRTWEIADLIAERRHFTDGQELMMQGVMDGMGDGSGQRATVLGPSRAQERCVRTTMQSGD